VRRKLIKKHVFIFAFQFTADEELRVKITLQFCCALYWKSVKLCTSCHSYRIWYDPQAIRFATSIKHKFM